MVGDAGEMKLNNEEELYKRESRNRINGTITIFRIIARPGGRYFYNPEIARVDRLLFICLESDGQYLEFPFSVADQEALWEKVFNVWVKPEKKYRYAMRFKKLIERKLLQGDLNGNQKHADTYENNNKQQSSRAGNSQENLQVR